MTYLLSEIVSNKTTQKITKGQLKNQSVTLDPISVGEIHNLLVHYQKISKRADRAESALDNVLETIQAYHNKVAGHG